MKENSRIKFNPATKEIEIEGSEGFVTACFDKIQAIMSGNSEAIVEVKKVRRGRKPRIEQKAMLEKSSPAKKEPTAVKARPEKKATKKEPGAKRVTHIDMITELVRGNAEGISIAELRKKMGLTKGHLSNIITRATKLGKIRKVKRGVYGTV
jgi:hypothetical protein